MNSKIVAAFILASAIAAPAFADGEVHYPEQQSQPIAVNSNLTRAQVKQELVELRKAGYVQSEDHNTYPTEIQAAEARVKASDQQSPAASGYGGVPNQSVASGKAHVLARKLRLPVGSLQDDGMTPIYFGS